MKTFIKIKVTDNTIRRRGHNEYVKMITPLYLLSGKDLMMKGGKFYAVLNNDTNMWSTNEIDVFNKIDSALFNKRIDISKEDSYGRWRTEEGDEVIVSSLDNSTTKELINYRTWESKLPPNFNYKQLDTKLTFIDEEVKPEDYRSKRLNYKLEDGSINAYNNLMSVLYSSEEREKLEWAIGSIFAGDSSSIEKIVVLYGDPGTGKSTVLDLVKGLFDGYWSPFVAADLVRKSDQFATSMFKDNPLVAIQDDGSLAKIESPIINEIVSHKDIIVNEKGKQRYKIKPNAMLFLATNELVDIHDTKLGITRRLLDIYPTGNKVPVNEYRRLVSQLKFEYGAIAYHCLNVYKSLGKEYYLNYSPFQMIAKTNIMRNFIFDNYEKFVDNDPVTRNVAYEWYKSYFEESGLGYPPKRIIFGEQLKEYYKEYEQVKWIENKTRRHVYSGFKTELFNNTNRQGNITLKKTSNEVDIPEWLQLKDWTSDGDMIGQLYPDIPAQYAKGDNDIPSVSWNNCKTTLKTIIADRTHYCLTQVAEPKLIVIDFDKKDENGKKSFLKNVEEASKWPETYAELSKGGEGIHLHYIYDGDITKLNSLYADDIEIKVFTGKQALRRRLSKCNRLPIAILYSGSLPLKGDKKKMLNWDGVKDEQHLRNIIVKDLKKESFTSTIQSIKHICDVIKDAESRNIVYDISDLRGDIYAFASNSSHHAQECLKLVNDIPYASVHGYEGKDYSNYSEDDIVFFDVEVFPNINMICYKKLGVEGCYSIIAPSPDDIKDLCKFKLVGFNNLKYDNIILYGIMLGYNASQVYELSKRLISGTNIQGMYSAKNISYTDIYDFVSKKQSLKKYEIELGITHKENHYDWNEVLPEEHWNEVVDYCKNDVIATEQVFLARKADYEARLTLAKIAGGTPNDTTNSLTTRLIFGDNKHPQNEFIYTDLSKQFPGYLYKDGVSTYRGEIVGEGGYVYANEGMYRHVITFDVASMHPHSAIALNIFGDRYTARFKDLVDARIAIKHKDISKLETIFDGAFKEFINSSDEELKNLASALKIAINSVYGLTAAKFDNPFKDPNNIDNIVAKRGALFMINLKNEVQRLGAKVVHIKTDSIKVENPTNDVKEFILSYGKKYGYSFEIESTYERMCLVNKAVYVAKTEDGEWTATGAQFQHPYVFKTLFSKEPLIFADYKETKSATTALYLDMNEGFPEGEHSYHFIGKVGSFVPIKPGLGGGLLLRQSKDGGYGFASNSKDYRWLEADVVETLHRESNIDISYYEKLVDDAKNEITKYCGEYTDWFFSDEKWMLDIPSDELPF